MNNVNKGSSLFGWMASALVAVLCLHVSAELVHWDFPRNGNCHEGLPFADGCTGVLVWGGVDGNLNITLGRSDLWDHRGGYPWTNEQNYTNITAAALAGNETKIRSLFVNEKPAGWVGGYNPYMLPLGRVHVKYDPAWTLRSGDLDPYTGLAVLHFERPAAPGSTMVLKATAELAMNYGSFAIRFPEEISFTAEATPAMTYENVRKVLLQRGFKDATVYTDTSCVGIAADAAGGFDWAMPAEPERPGVVRWWAKDHTLFVQTARTASAKGDAALTFDQIRTQALDRWTSFWAKSARIHVPDPTIQMLYEFGLYKFGAMTDPKGVPAGLQGPWLEDDKLVPWGGDYHFNINIQACYAPSYRSGHTENLLPLFKMVLSWRPRLRDNARKFCGIENGYTMPHSVDDRGVCIGGFWTGTIDHGSSAWVADMMFRYVEYSGDVAFLREGAYDFMKGVMNVYRALMVERNGALYLPMGPSPEWGGDELKDAIGANPSFQLAAAHKLARDLMWVAKKLGEEPDPMWLEVDQRLPLYSMDEKTGISVFENRPFNESHRHHSHMAGLFPFDTINLVSDQDVVRKTYANWMSLGTKYWSGWCVPWAAVLCVHNGDANQAVQFLHDWNDYFCDEGHGSHHNSVFGNFTEFKNGRSVMQMDGQCAATAAVMELLAHDVNGKTEFFRGCPASWKEVSFENLHLSDGRTVSGSRKDGVITIQ